jgi:formylglycine-generating enzyme required for sulfatase activity
VAIQKAVQIVSALQETEPPHGLPRRYAPRNDECHHPNRKRSNKCFKAVSISQINKENNMRELQKNLIELLLKHFPENYISYEDFVSDDMMRKLYGDKDIIEKYFQLLSVPWTRISWLDVANTQFKDVSGLVILPLLSPKGFAHVFPSLLLGLTIDNVSHLLDENSSFIEQLDLREIDKEWKKDFFISLNNEVKEIVSLIMHIGGSTEAIESYWHAYRFTNKSVSAKNLGLNFDEVKPDLFIDEMGFSFNRIVAGSFKMGSNVDARFCDLIDADTDKRYGFFENEKTRHLVHITHPFYMGLYPVTQKQWIKLMGNNPSYFIGDDLPVEGVSWNDAQEFIAKLNAYLNTYQQISILDQDVGYVVRLPTEAEWEYACRAVSESDPERDTKANWRWFFGDDPVELEHYAWFEKNATLTTHPVGKKRPNPWGLYDLYGNVAEWVWDNYGDYPKGEVTDPSEPFERLVMRSIRGGCWYHPIRNVRSASRSAAFPQSRYCFTGFRLVIGPRLRY